MVRMTVLKAFHRRISNQCTESESGCILFIFFPQFIKPEYGSVFTQSLELGAVQVLVSFSVNFVIVLTAARVALFFSNNPAWIRAQKWFMAGVLTYLAVKMAFSKAK